MLQMSFFRFSCDLSLSSIGLTFRLTVSGYTKFATVGSKFGRSHEVAEPYSPCCTHPYGSKLCEAKRRVPPQNINYFHNDINSFFLIIGIPIFLFLLSTCTMTAKLGSFPKLLTTILQLLFARSISCSSPHEKHFAAP